MAAGFEMFRDYFELSRQTARSNLDDEIRLPPFTGPQSVRPILGRHATCSDANLDDDDDLFMFPRRRDSVSTAGDVGADTSFRTKLNSVEDDDVFSSNDSPKGFSLPDVDLSNACGLPETPYASHSGSSWSSSTNNPFLLHSADFAVSVPGGSAIGSRRATPNTGSTTSTGRSTRSSVFGTPDTDAIPGDRYKQYNQQYVSPQEGLPIPSSQQPANWQNGASLNGAWDGERMATSTAEFPAFDLVTQLANFQESLCQSMAKLNIQGQRTSETNVLPIEPSASPATGATQCPGTGFYQINGLQTTGYSNNSYYSSYRGCPTPTSPQGGQWTASGSLDGLANTINDMDSQVTMSNVHQFSLLLQLLLQQNGQAAPPATATSQIGYPYNNRSLEEGRFCAFCKRNRETKEFYTTHVVKDSRGKVICPVLRKYTCPVCKATGDNAHTLRHCPVRLHAARNPQP